MYKRVIREAFLSSIPVMMGYIVLGIAFGMLLENKGYGVVYALLMSVFIYAGSMQFVAINLLSSSGFTSVPGGLTPSVGIVFNPGYPF